MPRRNNRFVFLTLVALTLGLLWGCEQPDDVLTGVSSTRLTLTAQRLPTLPAGVTYELWVADDNDTVSLGKFLYNHQQVKYFDINMNERSNVFMLDDDVYGYSTIFVSVETDPDDDAASPGPIMLVDEITDPAENPITMYFPDRDTLWTSIARYNMEAVSDENRNANDGHGVWFSIYQQIRRYFPDTTGAEWRYGFPTPIPVEESCWVDPGSGDTLCDTLNWDEILFPRPWEIDSTWLETTLVQYGKDTLLLGPPRNHISFKYHIDSIIDSIPPYEQRAITFRSWDITDIYDTLDLFTQDEFGLPDYSAWGWRYKGWVVSPYIDTTVVTARLTPPAWPYNTAYDEYIPGAKGALVTTGTFFDITAPDDANPYVIAGGKTPDYPGEDFLDASALLSAYGVDEIDLMPVSESPHIKGTVFISLEPVSFSSTTNFPLVAFIGPVPENRNLVTGDAVQVTMWNFTQSLDNDLRGFPAIDVAIERF